MVDWTRIKPEDGRILKEKVYEVFYDQNRSAHLALVASGDKKRYIIATSNMKPGDIIESSSVLTKSAVLPQEGNAYPVGSLPVGTLINNVERLPYDGSKLARSAGVSAQLLRKTDDGNCIIRLPSKQEVSVPATCIATVGRVSNVDHDKRVMGKAGANRWLGIRPSSGRWHRKTGRFGLKIKPAKKLKTYSGKSKSDIKYVSYFASKTFIPREKKVKVLPYKEHVAVNRPVHV
eukprot:GHVT01071606.1.p1 GENE.GHVT01071606.1~~GHVT01071606.1.p1  ORF type:complete len:261 (-),score=-8.58 GHVT01071606.1:58-756(-)